MQEEAIIAALIGAATAGGGLQLRRIFGAPEPQTDAEIAAYYRNVIEGLIHENTDLRKEMEELRRRVTTLEVNPPPHLG